MLWIVLLMIVTGMVFLTMSLPFIESILRTLGEGPLYRQWKWLRRLILAFLAGYAAFGLLHLGSTNSVADLIVSVILGAGGVFVFIVARLSDLTTKDIARISGLERDVLRDPLTGLFNRRHLAAKLDQETGHARQSGAPLSALAIDIDHFKRINDAHGHLTGDHVVSTLQRVSCPFETLASQGFQTLDGFTKLRRNVANFVVLGPRWDHGPKL